MIAACAPSLKPLVSKALKLSDYTHSHTRDTSGNHYASRSRSRSMPWHNQYALEELGSNEDGKRSDEVQITNGASGYSATATFYNASGSEENHSRSEEMILGGRPPQPDIENGMGDIVLTTEVIVR
jgi:hypothetical protein